MDRNMFATRVVAAALLAVLPLRGAGSAIETADLVVTDATGRIAAGELQGLAEQAQKTLGKVLAFWSADSGRERFGRIHVLFDTPRREFYSCVFYWEKREERTVRVVRVLGYEGGPQMLAHKLTSAVFPQKDKLIRNMMGILAETRAGDAQTFPMGGYSTDEWVLALRELGAYIPLAELGPDHESWGMRDAGGGRLQVLDKARQHRAYAEAGSFGNYVFETFGITRLKRLQRLSQEKDRPWQEVFGKSLAELEADWLKHLERQRQARTKNVAALVKLLAENPGTACAAAQKLSSGQP